MAERRIRISITEQRLELLDGKRILTSYPVSTATRGAGERRDSEQTPRGRLAIEEKIGSGAALGTVFVGRQTTGEVCTAQRFAAEPGRDWILTRVLWLGGREPGRNQGGAVDTRERTIYIHGTPDVAGLGQPTSHGCIRMRSEDVVDLFDQVEVGTSVDIDE
jgi:L,D-transpeptidase YbiS